VYVRHTGIRIKHIVKTIQISVTYFLVDRIPPPPFGDTVSLADYRFSILSTRMTNSREFPKTIIIHFSKTFQLHFNIILHYHRYTQTI